MRRPPRVTARLRRRRRPRRTIAIRFNRSIDSSFDSLIRRSNDRERPLPIDDSIDRSIVSISGISNARDRPPRGRRLPPSPVPSSGQRPRAPRARGGVPHVRSHRVEGLACISWVGVVCGCFEGHDPWVCGCVGVCEGGGRGARPRWRSRGVEYDVDAMVQKMKRLSRRRPMR